MKLNSLYLDGYKLLNPFTIDFSKDISILIGINGSGKSSVLEAIAQIFSDAILKEKSKFGFILNYNLRLEEVLEQTATSSEFRTDYINVEISAPEMDHALAYKVHYKDEILVKEEEIIEKFNNFQRILPSNIVIYYSGLSDIMKSICEPHDKVLSKNYRAWNTNVSRPFFYFQPTLFDIILISLLSFEFGDVPSFLAEKIKISGVQSVQIKLKKPSWSKQKLDKWWGAKGEIKTFLDFLSDRMENTEYLDFLISKEHPATGNIILEAIADEYLIITIIGRNKLFEIREFFVEERALFKILSILVIDGFWDSATFSLIKEENSLAASFGVLSEGEQQSVIIKGLMELVTSENTLFLFDEPDTFLHPSWQRTFIENVVNFSEKNEPIRSQFLITTHSPQLLSNANYEKAEVQIMENGKMVGITPKYYGRDIGTILYEMMGVQERNKEVTKLISNLFNLIEDEDLEKAKGEFASLSSILGSDDPVLIRAKTQLDYLEELKNEAN